MIDRGIEVNAEPAPFGQKYCRVRDVGKSQRTSVLSALAPADSTNT